LIGSICRDYRPGRVAARRLGAATRRNPRKYWAVTDPLDHIRKLAEGIGPRPATSKAERAAAEYIEQQLQKFGFTVKVEPFRSVRSFSPTYIAIFVLAIAGFIAAAVFDKGALGLLLTGIAGVAFIGENTTTLHLARTLIPQGKSQNVVGRLAARDLPRRRLVLVAHYDSAKSGVMWQPGLVRDFRRIFVLQAISMIVLPILVGFQGVTGERLFGYIAIPFAANIILGLLLLLHREVFYKHVAGANDNASGVGVMLSLCEALAADVPADTEVMAVATGCEEAGLVGMEKFLSRHKDDLGRAWIINIDNVGAGEVSYTTAEGMMLKHRAGKDLTAMAAQVAKMPGLRVSGRPFRVMSLDTEPVLLRRLEAMTVIATRDGVPVNWHRGSDTYDAIDPDSVDTAYRFVEAMVRRLIA
jgi:hypothetical protein